MPTKKWIGLVVSRAEKTVSIDASSRKEAMDKLRNSEYEAIDVSYDIRGYQIVGREDIMSRRNRQKTPAATGNVTACPSCHRTNIKSRGAIWNCEDCGTRW